MFRPVSLNLNGIRSAASKGFVEWEQGVGADCMAVQEVRAQAEDLGRQVAEALLDQGAGSILRALRT